MSLAPEKAVEGIEEVLPGAKHRLLAVGDAEAGHPCVLRADAVLGFARRRWRVVGIHALVHQQRRIRPVDRRLLHTRLDKRGAAGVGSRRHERLAFEQAGLESPGEQPRRNVRDAARHPEHNRHAAMHQPSAERCHRQGLIGQVGGCDVVMAWAPSGRPTTRRCDRRSRRRSSVPAGCPGAAW